MDFNAVIGIQGGKTSSPAVFVQDAILAGTSFIGTVVVISLVMAGIRLVRGTKQQVRKGSKGVAYAMAWLLLVAVSYTVIRLVQFLAQG